MMIRTAPQGTTPLADARRWDWAEHAACRGKDLELFYGPPGEREPDRALREERAKDLCSACPVRAACLETALSRKPYDQHGVQGGMTSDERRAEIRKRVRRVGRRPAPKPTPKVAPTPRPERVDVIGTRRRLRALAAVGHGTVTIADRMGNVVAASHLNDLRIRETGTVIVRIAAAVASVYPDLIHERPHPNSHRVAHLAAERGWEGPGAWKGVDIDDPTARPRDLERSAA